MNAILSGRCRPRDFAAAAALVVTADALVAGGSVRRRLAGVALGAVLPAGVAFAVSRRPRFHSTPEASGLADASADSGAEQPTAVELGVAADVATGPGRDGGVVNRDGARGVRSVTAKAPGAVGCAVRSGDSRCRPADVVTFVRAVLAGCAFAAALRPRSRMDGERSWAVAGFTIPALALDAVDGPVARATGTSHPWGACLDMETDAAVLLGLSLVLSRTLTPRVLVIGAARYAFVAGGWLRPAWTGELPPSERRRTIAGLQAVALSVASAPVVPASVARGVLTASAALLAWSFARDVVLLERAARAADRTSSTMASFSPHASGCRC